MRLKELVDKFTVEEVLGALYEHCAVSSISKQSYSNAFTEIRALEPLKESDTTISVYNVEDY